MNLFSGITQKHNGNILNMVDIVKKIKWFWNGDEKKPDTKNFECWCQCLDWDKIISTYPDQARIYALHNCGKDDGKNGKNRTC